MYLIYYYFFLGCPLSLTENPYWQIVLSMLNPSFEIPSRHDISKPLLDDCYNSVKDRVDLKLNSSKTVGLQCDAWTNINAECIINFIVTTPQPVLFKSLETEEKSHTGENIAIWMSEVIEAIGPNKVLGTVTDNVAANLLAHKILSSKYEQQCIQFYGCGAHILNLLAKDIIALNSAAKILKNSSTAVNEIKKSKLILPVFKKIQKSHNVCKTSLKLPVPTRWSSHLFSLESVQKNKFNLQQLAISPYASSKLSTETKKFLLEEEFWISIKKLISILKPISNWISKIEGDTSMMHEMVQVFIELKECFDAQLDKSLSLFNAIETETISKKLEERKKMALRPIHFSANILDPKYRGAGLARSEYVLGSELISKICHKFGLDEDQVSLDLMSYINSKDEWGMDHVKKSAKVASHPSVWWGSACKFSPLSEIAVEVLSLPCTSASTERTFSTAGWIHDKKRNRLLANRAGKVTYIAHNLKMLDKSSKKKQKSQDSDISEDENSSLEDEELVAENCLENVNDLESSTSPASPLNILELPIDSTEENENLSVE